MTSFPVYMVSGLGILSLIVSWWFYRPKQGSPQMRFPRLPFFLRALSLWTLFVLLWAPDINTKEITRKKPALWVLADNSASMKTTRGAKPASQILDKIKHNSSLSDKFDIQYFAFDSRVRETDSLDFSGEETDLAAALHYIAKIDRNRHPVVLITDGRITKGRDYTYVQHIHPVYAFVTGDTTKYIDLAVSRVDVNPYAFLHNRFPVEIEMRYTGDTKQSSALIITREGKTVYKSTITFDPAHPVVQKELYLDAQPAGLQYYQVALSPLANEKNTRNNRSVFQIEILDDKREILLVAGLYHPDIAAIRRIVERSKQNKLRIVSPGNFPKNLSGYSQVILYQPDASFDKIFKTLQKKRVNTFIITGNRTDWSALNRMQQAFHRETTGQREEYRAVFNTAFSGFVTEDPGFADFPPLKGHFGKITFHTDFDPLLYQKISGIKTGQALLALYRNNDGSKHAVLFGEGLWRWRMHYLSQSGDQTAFDDYWATIFRYLQPGKKVKRYDLHYEKILLKNRDQHVSIRFFDENYQSIKGLQPVLVWTSPEGKTEKIPMLAHGETYRADIPELAPGNYSMYIRVPHFKWVPKGRFTVKDYSPEQQYFTADEVHLRQLTAYTGGALRSGGADDFIADLVENPAYKPVLKEKYSRKSYIDLWYLLALFIVSLSLEWLIRKYRGLI